MSFLRWLLISRRPTDWAIREAPINPNPHLESYRCWSPSHPSPPFLLLSFVHLDPATLSSLLLLKHSRDIQLGSMSVIIQSIHVAPPQYLCSTPSLPLVFIQNHFLTKAFSATISRTAVPAGNTLSSLSYFVFSAYCCPTSYVFFIYLMHCLFPSLELNFLRERCFSVLFSFLPSVPRTEPDRRKLNQWIN